MNRLIAVAALAAAMAAVAAEPKKTAEPTPAKKGPKTSPATGSAEWTAPSFSPPPVVPAATEPKLDEDASILVTVRHMNGETETYSRNLDSMDLVFEPSGRLAMVHLVVISGQEKDTHKWYSFQNLGSFSYRFLNLAGKGKVRLKMMAAFEKDKDDQQTTAMPGLTGKDYR